MSPTRAMAISKRGACGQGAGFEVDAFVEKPSSEVAQGISFEFGSIICGTVACSMFRGKPLPRGAYENIVRISLTSVKSSVEGNAEG